MPIRRAADPSSVQLVLDAVRWTIIQRQQPDLPRLSRYLQRVREFSITQAELYIKQTVQDGFITAVQKLGTKGCKTGVSVESYRIPTLELENPEDDGHDWYCIECHLGGDVITCRTCHRVYHAECSTNAVQKKLESSKPVPFQSSIAVAKKLPPSSRITDKQQILNKSPIENAAKEEDVVVANKVDLTVEENNKTDANKPETCVIIDSTKELEKKDESDDEKKPPETTKESEHTDVAVQPESKIKADVADTVNASESCESVKEVEEVENAKKKIVTPDATNNAEDVIELNDSDDLMNGDAIPSSKLDSVAEINCNNTIGDCTKSEYNYECCSICNLLKTENDSSIPQTELNYLLTFTLNRIKSWLPASITDTMSPEPKHEWLNEQEVSWRSRQLIYQPMDVPIMELKVRTNEYNSLTEFHVDILTIQHNVAVYHGIESQEYGASEFMLQDCCYDLNEIKQCPDCYRHSNEKTSSRWFCVPCRVPHELVWAKQKGYPHWPAKIIKKIGGNSDVRFFGAKHLRAVIPNTSIKPIDIKMQSLQIKRTPAFNKAYEELTLHQRLLKNPDDVKVLIHSTPKPSKTSTTKTTSSKKKNYDSWTPLSKQDIRTSSRKRKSTPDIRNDVYEFHDSPLEAETPLNSTPVAPKRPKSSGKSSKSDKASTSKGKSPAKDSKKAIQSPSRRTRSNNSHADNHSDVIDISNVQDFDDNFLDDSDSFNFQGGYDGSQELVSSSTEHIRMQPTLLAEQSPTERQTRRNSNASTQQLDRPYSDAVEKLRRQLEQQADRTQMIKLTMDAMQGETDRLTNGHSEQIRNMFEAHNTQLSETKKKQWCYNCEQEAIYHCCWNTAYCSTTCQQQHWQSEHKKVCRRKR